MILTYTLTGADFLNFQLYQATKSKRIKNNRLKSRIAVVIVFISLSFLFHTRNDVFLTRYFLVAAAVALLFFPYYQRWLYRRNYRKFVDENYKARVNKPFTLHLDEDKLWSKDEQSEGNISLASLKEIVEVPSAFYIRTATDMTLLLPKQQLSDENEVKLKLELTAKRFGFPYKQELNWHWK